MCLATPETIAGLLKRVVHSKLFVTQQTDFQPSPQLHQLRLSAEMQVYHSQHGRSIMLNATTKSMHLPIRVVLSCPMNSDFHHAYAYRAPPAAAAAACCGLTFLPSLLYRTRGGGARLRRPSRERTLQLRISMRSISRGIVLFGGVPNDLAVNGAGNAVLKLQVHLGHRVLGEDGGI